MDPDVHTKIDPACVGMILSDLLLMKKQNNRLSLFFSLDMVTSMHWGGLLPSVKRLG